MYGLAGGEGPAPDGHMSPGRGVSPKTTASRFRGYGPTQTLQLKLLRQSQKLRSMEASVNSSECTAQRKKVANMLAESKRHFRSEHVDMAWEEDLSAQVEEAKNLCLQKDGELDFASKTEKEREARKKALQTILTKGFGTKFLGKASSWPLFREQFLHVIAIMD